METLIQPMATVRGSCTSFSPSNCPLNFGGGEGTTCNLTCYYQQ